MLINGFLELNRIAYKNTRGFLPMYSGRRSILLAQPRLNRSGSDGIRDRSRNLEAKVGNKIDSDTDSDNAVRAAMSGSQRGTPALQVHTY